MTFINCSGVFFRYPLRHPDSKIQHIVKQNSRLNEDTTTNCYPLPSPRDPYHKRWFLHVIHLHLLPHSSSERHSSCYQCHGSIFDQQQVSSVRLPRVPMLPSTLYQVVSIGSFISGKINPGSASLISTRALPPQK